jgi:hypothetical protein
VWTVPEEYVRAMRTAGIAAPQHRLCQLRRWGVDRDYVARWIYRTPIYPNSSLLDRAYHL